MATQNDRTRSKFIPLFAFLIAISALAADRRGIQEISVPESLRDRLKSFEPSGLAYLPSLSRFLVVSDDTDEDDSPMVFLLQETGELDARPMRVRGISTLTDLESVSVLPSGDVLLMGSQGLNKKGKDLPERNRLLRATLRDRTLQVVDQVELRPRLLEAFESSADPGLQALQSGLREELDVESHFVRGEHLIVGLKNPQPAAGRALLLDLGRLDSVFKKEISSSLKVFAVLDFKATTGEADLLSDLVRIDDTKLLVATSTERGFGRLWSYDLPTGKLLLLREFPRAALEGVTFRNEMSEVWMTFDQGEDAALFGRLRVR